MTDWEKIQLYIITVIIATVTIGFGVLIAMWIGI